MLNRNLQFPDGIGFYPDVQDGKRGYNTDAARGADTFYPFKSGAEHFNYYYLNVTSITTPNVIKEFTVTSDGTLNYNLLYQNSRSATSYLSLYVNSTRIEYFSNNNSNKYDQTYDVKAGDIVNVEFNGSGGFMGAVIFDAYVE